MARTRAGAAVPTSARAALLAGDADQDGLSDLVENLIGSDRGRMDTLGHGVPDGWVYAWLSDATDWNSTTLLQQAALVPPPGAVPRLAADSMRLPTFAQVYEHEAEGKSTTAWWTKGNTLNPLDWDNDRDGIADAWMLTHGLAPGTLNPDQASPGDPAFTLREKYELGLDPSAKDTDRDGLLDVEELAGNAVFGGMTRSFDATNPRRFSTRGDGLSDGFIVRVGFSPSDVDVGDRTPTPNGLSVREAFQETERACKIEIASSCSWPDLLESGRFVDPNKVDTNGDLVPDAWIVRTTAGRHTVFENASKIQVADSGQWDSAAAGPAGQGLVVDDLNPRPDGKYTVSLAQTYAFGRPATWDEAAVGPWWGGIPLNFTPPGSALPVPVALRGWRIAVDPCRGCIQPTARSLQQVVIAEADPRLADSDGDGVSDLDEYRPDSQSKPRTNPLDPDTDGDGLGDGQETPTGLGTTPVRRDSAGSFLTDGEAFGYWTGRHAMAIRELDSDPTGAEFHYRHLKSGAAATLRASDLDRLLPSGSLDGKSPNLLSADPDQDGLRTGAELFPALYLDMPTTQGRPATDPARKDTDGDQLPDAWEIRWSRTRDYGCRLPCASPIQGFTGWPIDPTRYDSFDPQATEVNPGTSASDFGRDLKGQSLRLDARLPPVNFTNGMAYEFDLEPYQEDSSPGDGIPDLFALEWGVLQVPSDVRASIDQSVAGGQTAHAWIKDAAEALASRRPEEFTQPITHVILDPSRTHSGINLETNLQEMFLGREKGTWVYSRDPCATKHLPASGHRADGIPGIPARDLHAPCWSWVAYPIGADLPNGTNPWRHDFDGDGMPDAWEAHYVGPGGATAGEQTPSSQHAGCDEASQLRSLPPAASDNTAGHCLTYLEAYRLGLDPTSEDTDGGGLVDWLEVATGNLDPLDEADDRGDEDWDGDGLLNRVESVLGTSRFSPDSDLDGLLDGDGQGIEPAPYLAFGSGEGDLCLRGGSDPMPLMAHRPAFIGQRFLGAPDPGASLNRSQVLAWHRAFGILLDDAPGGRCPSPTNVEGTQQPFSLLKREVALDRWSSPGFEKILGAGGGTNPLAWDSTGTAIPDGWLVYWRDSAPGNDNVRSTLRPTDSSSAESNPDGDLITRDEYLWARPHDWDESRDGVWWGGLDPTRGDTDGDEDWYRSFYNGGDVLDQDEDGDGLPLDVDPDPGMDHANTGVVSYQGSGYLTDYSRLWTNLHARGTWDLADRDGDRVPDAIDRARTAITASASTMDGQPLTSLSKSSPAKFVVAGHLSTQETPGAGPYAGNAAGAAPGQGTAVAHATVAILASDGQRVSLVGAAITDDSGDFRATCDLAPRLDGPTLTTRASIRGRTYPAGTATSLPSDALGLNPGRIELWAMAEPNDPVLQPLKFAGLGSVVAFKDVEASNASPAKGPETAPRTAPALRAARLNDAQDDPDLAATAVVHAAEAIQAGHSTPIAVDLRAGSQLAAELLPSTPRHGVPFEVRGFLKDFAGVPLAGRAVTVLLGTGPNAVESTIQTGSDGAFSKPYDGNAFPVGDFAVVVRAQLSTDDRYLDPPEQVQIATVMAQDSAWLGLLSIDGHDVLEGGEQEIDAADRVRVRGSLIESPSGSPIQGRLVRLALASVEPHRDLVSTLARSSGTGGIDVLLPALPSNTPASLLKLSIQADPVTTEDRVARANVFLSPIFESRITFVNTSASVNHQAALNGHLERLVAGTRQPVEGSAGSIVVRCGPETIWANTTGPGGGFSIRIVRANPVDVTCQALFAPGHGTFLKASNATARVSFATSSELRVSPVDGAVGQTVPVQGRLVWGNHRPIPDQPVVGRWTNGAPVTAMTGPDGTFSLMLPSRDSAGLADLQVEFGGTRNFEATTNFTRAVIRSPTIIRVVAPNATLHASGLVSEGAVASLLVRSTPVGGRPILFEAHGPSGAVLAKERITADGGNATLQYDDLAFDRPGNWTIWVRFAGSDLELPAEANATINVTAHVRMVFDRAPPSAFPGQKLQVLGHVEGRKGIAFPFSAAARLGDGPVATFQAMAGGNWSAVVEAPDVAPGSYKLVAGASNLPQFVVEPIEVHVNVMAATQVQLEVNESASGARQVVLRLTGNLLASPTVVVARQVDGRIVGIHEVPTADGVGRMELQAAERGDLSVLQVGDRLYSIDAVFVDVNTVEAVPVARQGHWVPWTIAGGATLLALAAMLSYVVWRRQGRRDILEMLREAQRALSDPALSTHEVIRRAYAHLMDALKASGYTPTPSQTVRSILKEAGLAFALPATPWRGLSALFEEGAYSSTKQGQAERGFARRAFAELADHLSRRGSES